MQRHRKERMKTIPIPRKMKHDKDMCRIGRYLLFNWWIFYLELSADEFHSMINSPINDLTLKDFLH